MVTFVAIFGFGGFLLTLLIELSEDGYTRRDMLFHPPLLGLLAAAFAAGYGYLEALSSRLPPLASVSALKAEGSA